MIHNKILEPSSKGRIHPFEQVQEHVGLEMKNTLHAYLQASLATIRRAGWLPLSIFLLHEICAHVVDGYTLWPPVDIPLHLFGGFAIAFFTSGAIATFADHDLIQRPHALVHAALVFSLACTAAVFWEFAEWTADHMLGTSCQVGLDDTILDLLMGAVGGGVFAAAILMKIMKDEMSNKMSGPYC